MGTLVLRNILHGWQRYELDDSIYLPAGASPSLDLEVIVLPFDPGRPRVFDGQEYWLGIEQIRDVVEGLETQLHRSTSADERLKAVAHYAQYDAFIDPANL